MNLFYEAYPQSVFVNGVEYPIVTDFRNYIALLDMLKDDSVSPMEKGMLILEYFPDSKPDRLDDAVDALCGFINMLDLPVCGCVENEEEGGKGAEENAGKKNLYSFSIDYPCIISGFLHDYGVDLQKIKYLHWWKFRMLFDNLSEDTEIRQRIYYRGKDLGTVKDKDERKRIAEIQRRIQLPDENLSDYDIGDAFAF